MAISLYLADPGSLVMTTPGQRIVRVVRPADIFLHCTVCGECLRGQQRYYCSRGCQEFAYRARRDLRVYFERLKHTRD
jgi:predicted nucleic acid-binding Zn ribbon protein